MFTHLPFKSSGRISGSVSDNVKSLISSAFPTRLKQFIDLSLVTPACLALDSLFK